MWNGKTYVDYVGYILKFVSTQENKCINVRGKKGIDIRKIIKRERKLDWPRVNDLGWP
jgi:hypothetical protein